MKHLHLFTKAFFIIALLLTCLSNSETATAQSIPDPFTDVSALAGVDDTGKGSTATWGDYDNDGWLDLYVTSWACHPECDPIDFNLSRDTLYHNNGPDENGIVTFEDVTDLLVYPKLLGAGFTASFMDYDDDGDLDIYVVNDALMNPIGNVLWRNDGSDVDGICGGWCLRRRPAGLQCAGRMAAETCTRICPLINVCA